MYELTELSKNEFYAMDIQTNRVVTPGLKRGPQPAARASATR